MAIFSNLSLRARLINLIALAALLICAIGLISAIE
jgi:cell division protein FtsL